MGSHAGPRPAAGGTAATAAVTPLALECRGLTYRFGLHTAVDDLHLGVRQGEMFGLLGPNGAGKTTTIRVITTLLPVDPGRVWIFGLDAARRRMQVRRLLGYVPQLLSADAALTGRENVSLFAALFDVPRRERKLRVEAALAAMGLDSADADRLVGRYSGGMIRRLELAQALVNTPRLLVLDEPTVGLDPHRPLRGVGSPPSAAGRRDDGAGHDPLHGGGRSAVRHRGPHAPAGSGGSVPRPS